MEILFFILLWYILPLIIGFIISYYINKYEKKKSNPDRNLSILFGFSVLPAINILLLIMLIFIGIIVLAEEIGKYLIKEK